MKIANFEIAKNTFIIAEIGSNHNGNLDKAKELVTLAKQSGADAVKFQTYNAHKFIDKSVLPMAHVRGKYKSQQERFKSLEFTLKQWETLIKHVQKEDLIFFSTPADFDSADFLDRYVTVFKIQSGDVTNIALIRHVIKKNKPIIMSTGMADESEIEAAVREIPKDKLILLHCVSIYPTPADKVALHSIPYLRKKFNVPVGYSDHTMDSLACLSAVALGAVVIERHFTDNKNQPLGDHKFSADPLEFKEMVRDIREIESMRRNFNSRLTESELNMRYAMRRGLSLTKDVPAGTVLTEQHLLPLRPEKGISASRLDFVVGKKTNKDLKEGHFIEESDIAQDISASRVDFVIGKKTNKDLKEGHFIEEGDIAQRRKYALFTCDTEFTPPWNEGSWTNQERQTFQAGIQNIVDILSKFDIRGTFYCQGLLVQDYPELVCGLAKNHLIGSHGYNHENYGGQPVDVYTRQQPVFLKDRDKKLKLLEKCKEIHKEVIGYQPEVFVAPFDAIDYGMLEILQSLGFKMDSSFDNYRLALPSRLFKPQSLDIYELPLSVIRFENYGYKNILQGLTFDYGKISEVLSIETIFLTCHPYEFIDIKIPHPEHVLIVGERKIEALEKLIQDLLKERYEFVDPLQLLEKTQQIVQVNRK